MRPRGQRPAPRPEPRVTGPDDDPDFLRDLDRKKRQPPGPRGPHGLRIAPVTPVPTSQFGEQTGVSGRTFLAMSDDPAQPGEGADDLFGRWLAHREKPSEDGEAPRPLRVPAPRALRGRRPVSPSARIRSPRRTCKAPTVDKRDGLGPVMPPSAFGVKRGLPGSAHSGPSGAPRRGPDSEIAELDRPSPLGFEPVILALGPQEERAEGRAGQGQARTAEAPSLPGRRTVRGRRIEPRVADRSRRAGRAAAAPGLPLHARRGNRRRARRRDCARPRASSRAGTQRSRPQSVRRRPSPSRSARSSPTRT